MLQLTTQPAYCLTIHKVQAFTIRHDVNGCLEGMFALGQLYVLWSRVTDPKLFHAVGLPPADLLDEVAEAWAEAGLDVNACFAKAVSVTNEWQYDASVGGSDPCHNVRARLKPVHQEERRVKLRLFTFSEILNPQPKAADVVHALLDWIDAADAASQNKQEKPPFVRPDGNSIFPEDEEWWLIELEKRKTPEVHNDLANDSIADDNLTDNPSEAGLSSDGHDTEGDDSVSTDEALPLIPRVRNKLPPVVVQCQAPSSQRMPEARTSREASTVAPAPRRRLRTKTGVAPLTCTSDQQTDDLDVLLAGAPGGKLVVSRDSYHDLPLSVQGAFKRGDARIVVVEDEGDKWQPRAISQQGGAPRSSQLQNRGTTSSSND